MQRLVSVAQDLRYAARGLRRAPVFTFAAICAMALGTGSGTAVFSVVDRILFRSLPYPADDRLVSVGMVAPIAPQEFLLGYDYLDWRDRQTTFDAMGSWTTVGDCDLSEANPVRLHCGYVDTGFLPTLGIRPLLGRNFTRDEDRRNGPRAAILSYGLWQSRFAGDRGVVGRLAPIDGLPAIIVGVLPREFEMPSLAAVDVLLTEALDEAEQRSRRTATILNVVARLKPGATVQRAEQALAPLFQASLKDVPAGFRKDVSLRLRTLRDRQIVDARRASWLLLWAVAAVLLIACANVANLLLARAASRRRELAVRAALGATGGRLFRQALTESLLLGVCGGAAGVALAFLLLRFFVAIAPEGIPRLQQASVDPRILLFTLVVSMLSAVLFGAAPAFENTRTAAGLGQRVIGDRRPFVRYTLVAAQISVTMVLLTGAGLLLRSLWNLQNQPLGIRAGGVLTAEVTLGRTYSDATRRTAFFEDMEARLRRLPGVSEIAVADSMPPAASRGSMLYAAIDVEGRPQMTNGTGGTVSWRLVSPRYFAALRIPILRGRTFEEEDRGPSRNVIILSQSLVRRLFPGEDPVGRQLRPGRSGPWRTIVGVAGDVKNSGLAEAAGPEYYEPRKHSGMNLGRSAIAIIRAPADAAGMAGTVRSEIAALDPALPVVLQLVEQRVSQLAERPRFNALMLSLFAGMGLLLAAIGLYGVMSFLVTQRVREIGVRMALGATPAAVSRLILLQAGAWTAGGIAAGTAGSLIAVRCMDGMLFQVGARDPWLLAAAAGLLLTAALAAAWVPSRRAARVDPIQALRQE